MAILKADTTIGGVKVVEELQKRLPLTGGTITGNLTLKGSGNYGNKINFGDGDYVHLYEISDDKLEIKASTLSILSNNPVAGIKTPTADDHAANKAYVDSKAQTNTVSHLLLTLEASSWISYGGAHYKRYFLDFFVPNQQELTYEIGDFVFTPVIPPTSDNAGAIKLLAAWHCVSYIGFEYADGEYALIIKCLYKKPEDTFVLDVARLRNL